MAHSDSTEPTTSARRPDETDALGDAIAELAARIQAATYELLVMIRQFDERGGWGEGFASCAHWLNWRTGLAMGAAREKVRVARALADLPHLSEAMRRGTVSYSKVRAMVIKALRMALKRRRPAPGLLHHSDQGSPYASEDYQRVLEAHGLVGSMSRRGNCLDNAAIESWFSTLKHELGERFESCGEAKMALFDYIEVFYNQTRRHSTLGQISPAEFERRRISPAA